MTFMIKIIFNVFKSMHPNLEISRSAIQRLECELNKLYTKITRKVYKKEYLKPIRLYFPMNMSINIVSNSNYNIIKLNDDEELDLVNNYQIIKNDLNCSDEFSIVVLSAIEYVCKEIFLNTSQRFSKRHIIMNIRNNEELNNLFKSLEN